MPTARNPPERIPERAVGEKVSLPCFVSTRARSCGSAVLQVRIVLDRDEDMAITGQRHAFLGRYKARWRCLGGSCGWRAPAPRHVQPVLGAAATNRMAHLQPQLRWARARLLSALCFALPA